MYNQTKAASGRWVVVAKSNDDESLPVGVRSEIFVSRNHLGGVVEWIKDIHSNWMLVAQLKKEGIIEYED